MPPCRPRAGRSVQNIIRSSAMQQPHCFTSSRNRDSDKNLFQDRSTFFESGCPTLWVTELPPARGGPKTYFGMNLKNPRLKFGRQREIRLGDLTEKRETLAREPFAALVTGEGGCLRVSRELKQPAVRRRENT